ncbi:beta-N-acetylglucosaminidase domain-containing protein [uncultured Sphingosinicella sp.]|uniref:beta-N-acetylglucosaminidase domain-containing protein n=1 Tax=uncultured Sphingosinicella sp. TaxID=478748 RepID=UPI0030D71028|tara:strand:+ start:8692 stop:9762 length:1071 start_codon:yes stop_codon:yes gene_type:complete
MTGTTPPLGLIEGYFGEPWTWADRTHVMRSLAPHGFSFFIYAPKADAYLRRQWQDDHPAEAMDALAHFADACRDAGVAFGIGLTPYELHNDWSGAGKAALTARLKALGALRPDVIAILFDDMHGDIPGLAETQAAIVHHAASTLPARVLMCPSYYSDDPVLDRVFGARPANYLEDLGRLLDPAADVFWTGEEVCSREFTRGHLDGVSEQLRRKPVLWDNYPVNDGPRMSRFLHLRAFTGRHGIAGSVAGHAINPALQPWLTLAPAMTLAMSYAQGDAYRYAAAFLEAARQCYGSDLAEALETDLLSLNDSGLDRIPGERCTSLRSKYKAMDHPAADEVARFLEGGYLITGEAVQTQ